MGLGGSEGRVPSLIKDVAGGGGEGRVPRLIIASRSYFFNFVFVVPSIGAFGINGSLVSFASTQVNLDNFVGRRN
jgi:hypothetical protein